jgi:transposase
MRLDVENELQKIHPRELMLLNKSELARRMGCNRRTVDKYIKAAIEGPAHKPKREYPSKLNPYKSIIQDKVDTYGATAMAVYKFIQKKGYDGKYGIVNRFVKQHRKAHQQAATIRFETTPGLQAQVDWKETVRIVNRSGKEFVVNIFLIVLGYSRLKFLKLTEDKSQKTLFMCLFEAIKYFQGVPHELLFDNMATVVDRERSTFKSIHINQTFQYFAKDAGFTPVTCRPYRAKTKGKVEALAKLTARLKVYNGEFDTFADFEEITNEFMEEINQEVSQATGEIPAERFKKEQEYLGPLPSMHSLLSYFSYHKEYKVSKESMVTYKGQKYSVPPRYIGYLLNVLEDEEHIHIYYMEDVIACHPKGNYLFNYRLEHAREILRSDALKHRSDEDIDRFIKENLSHMDMLLR